MEDLQLVLNAISTVGFPIAACVALFWLYKETITKITITLDKLNTTIDKLELRIESIEDAMKNNYNNQK